MQERTVPNLNNMIGMQIEYLCEYTDTDDKKQKFCHWCVGTFVDVSNGTDDKKWRISPNGKKCYNRGHAAQIKWDAVFENPSSVSIVKLTPGKWNKQTEGAWRVYYE